MRFEVSLALVALFAWGCASGITSDPAILAQLPERVDYNFHIKPILSDRCYACHGPDENARQAELLLHTEEGAYETKLSSGRRAIVPGSLRRSEVARRIASSDPEHMMPPPESNLHLSKYEKALIARWIDQGAEWAPHWSFTTPLTPSLPTISREDWPTDDIDYFILARLEREGLSPSEQASRGRLIRRVTFDLTGLPPTIEEIDAFLEDTSADAYERVVDRLLASSRYGERMATEWMDLSRYADSHGYHADGVREMWPWRDWVIEAFNRNMPYDEFVTWQLAGDLLPEATMEQKLATGFHRNHPMTAEGGVIDEEYRVEYVVDRTNTTARAFLGVTMECARCHDHKYDPVSQKEYFQLAAFFNNVNELGMTGDDGNAGPLLMMPTEEEDVSLQKAHTEIQRLEGLLDERREEVLENGSYVNSTLPEGTLGKGLASHYPLDQINENETPNLAGKNGLVRGDLEVVDGPTGSALHYDDDYDYLELPEAGLFERTGPFTASVWLKMDQDGDYTKIMGNAFHKNTYWRGWEMFVDSLNHLSVRLIHAKPHNYLHVRTNRSIPTGEWAHVAVTYDGSSRAEGIQLYIGGQSEPVTIEFDNLYKSIHPVDHHYHPTNLAIRVARSYRAFGGNDGIYRGSMDDIRLYERALVPAEIALLANASPSGQDHALETYLHHYDAPYRQLLRKLQEAREQEFEITEPVREVMIMEDMDEVRPTYVLDRGLYDQRSEQVSAGVPAAFGAFPEDFPKNRLGLAQWLFEPSHPLTARVTVNRYWILLFGQGLVATPDDFGNQGALPSHPALLDHLATTFVESGWDVKALMKRLVMSSTYRQTSTPSPELLVRDGSNILLGRGPRHRLPAEMIRDNALSASGLLVEQVGGPSVKPYQPPGLWIEKGNFSAALLHYKQNSGDSLYRRSLYTFIRRTSPPPSMLVFDAPDRTTCFVQRQNTNTPTQALVLLNDPTYVEASRILAERMQREGGTELDEQIRLGFRLSTGRQPSGDELDLLKELYAEEALRYESAPEAIDSLFSVGEYPADTKLEPVTTAALAMVAGMMLNHDEAYTKR